MLIEALIALLIFFIGVLGLVGLQATLVRGQTDTELRAEAAFLASDLVAQMWADGANVAKYGNCAGHGPCQAWVARVEERLPNSSSTVAVNAAGGVTITINWSASDGVEHRFSTATSINPNVSL
jgi:type IV pilus assembly protein PilV